MSAHCDPLGAAPVSRARVVLPSLTELCRTGYLPATVTARGPDRTPAGDYYGTSKPDSAHRLPTLGGPSPPASPTAFPAANVYAAAWPYPCGRGYAPADAMRPLPAQRPTHYWKRKSHSNRLGTAIRKCTYCHTSTTRAWRPGPEGSATLCDRCGKKYKRQLAHYGRSISPGSGSLSPESGALGYPPSPVSTASSPVSPTSDTEFASLMCSSRPASGSSNAEFHCASPPRTPPSLPTATPHHSRFLQLLN
ncbi:hypothetical protein H4R34_000645 [Dimargaris verticillata]|uniref:GATA-type domain-containing protein n=1 Tax=Dimargaris verticillata TaxID=2761393 RepID=A0A9W8B7P3_9FUNG|nr:hypothetical protein H4R34_000645 [Dimargaris verticillata]